MNRPKTHLVLLARQGSTRLPGKMLRPFVGSTLFESAVERFQLVHEVDEIVLATTDAAEDDALARIGRALGLRVHRGSTDDVVGRMTSALPDLRPEDFVIRACCDNPLVMPPIIEQAVEILEVTGADLVTPFELNGWPFGYGAVCFRGEALRRIDAEATLPVHREHVENFAFDHPDHFRIAYQPALPRGYMPGLSTTVDTAEDLERVRSWAHALVGVPLAEQPFALVEIAGRREHRVPRFWAPAPEKRGGGRRIGFPDAEAIRFPREVRLLGPAGGEFDLLRRIEREVGSHAHSGLVVSPPKTTPSPSLDELFTVLVVGSDGRVRLPGGGSVALGAGETPLAEAWHGAALHAARLAWLNALETPACPLPTP